MYVLQDCIVSIMCYFVSFINLTNPTFILKGQKTILLQLPDAKVATRTVLAIMILLAPNGHCLPIR